MTTKELIRVEIERLKRQAEESKMEWVNEGYNQNAFAEDCRISSFDKLLSFLDTLPDEPSCPISDGWKPTEAQMNGLAHAINLDVYDAERYGLDSLYNDLKKLM